jgi:hypothetical protein
MTVTPGHLLTWSGRLPDRQPATGRPAVDRIDNRQPATTGEIASLSP